MYKEIVTGDNADTVTSHATWSFFNSHLTTILNICAKPKSENLMDGVLFLGFTKLSPCIQIISDSCAAICWPR